ncbi:MAG: amino acid--tRNA ligase-related protein [bacterium]
MSYFHTSMQQRTSNLIARAKIIANIRKWFEKNHFIEVETPILVDCPDLSPNFDILKTKIHNSRLSAFPSSIYPFTNQSHSQNCFCLAGNDDKGNTKSLSKLSAASIKYLITSPEFSMKKLLALEKLNNIYTITKVFRDNEENTGIHSIEFTMLEWYRKNADYTDIMQDTEELVTHLICFARPFPRLKISNLFKKYACIDNVEKLSIPVFTKIIHSREYSKDKNLTYEQCFNLIFLNEIESKLPKTPFFLIDYPAPLAALAKFKKNNPHIAERFELYINGIELCNGFSELTDGKEQLSRFKKENILRKRMGKPQLPIDYELCKKLDSISIKTKGHPVHAAKTKKNAMVGGNAIGIDRLVMILLNATAIDEVMY